jgi:ABC-type polar amino acid transport system ATPase subunit
MAIVTHEIRFAQQVADQAWLEEWIARRESVGP